MLFLKRRKREPQTHNMTVSGEFPWWISPIFFYHIFCTYKFFFFFYFPFHEMLSSIGVGRRELARREFDRGDFTRGEIFLEPYSFFKKHILSLQTTLLSLIFFPSLIKWSENAHKKLHRNTKKLVSPKGQSKGHKKQKTDRKRKHLKINYTLMT